MVGDEETPIFGVLSALRIKQTPRTDSARENSKKGLLSGKNGLLDSFQLRASSQPISVHQEQRTRAKPRVEQGEAERGRWRGSTWGGAMWRHPIGHDGRGVKGVGQESALP